MAAGDPDEKKKMLEVTFKYVTALKHIEFDIWSGLVVFWAVCSVSGFTQGDDGVLDYITLRRILYQEYLIMFKMLFIHMTFH